jgi:hypothetical protein
MPCYFWTSRVGWCDGNALYMYSGSEGVVWLQSRLEHRLSWLKLSGLPQSLQPNSGIAPQTRPLSFPSTSFRIHYSPSFSLSTLIVTVSVTENWAQQLAGFLFLVCSFRTLVSDMTFRNIKNILCDGHFSFSSFFYLDGLGYLASSHSELIMKLWNLWTVGRTLWTGDQPIARPLPIQVNTE